MANHFIGGFHPAGTQVRLGAQYLRRVQATRKEPDALRRATLLSRGGSCRLLCPIERQGSLSRQARLRLACRLTTNSLRTVLPVP